MLSKEILNNINLFTYLQIKIFMLSKEILNNINLFTIFEDIKNVL